MPAKIVFAHKLDFPPFAEKWEAKIGADKHPYRRDAVDFAHLAEAKCSLHSPLQPYADSIASFGAYINDNPRCEVACFVCLKCDWFPDGDIIGFCHFRRTWSNNIVLDYLGAHPFITVPPENYPSEVKGAGSVLLYFVVQVAKACGCDLIWGEATQNSCGYYQNVLKLVSVEDLIYIPKEQFEAFATKLEADWVKEKAGVATPVLEEILKIETENPPFVGTRNPIMVPPRKFVQHFLQLPFHLKAEIGKTLGLWEEGDQKVSDMELFRRLFARAIERGKAASFWREVESRAKDGHPDQNPFAV